MKLKKVPYEFILFLLDLPVIKNKISFNLIMTGLTIGELESILSELLSIKVEYAKKELWKISAVFPSYESISIGCNKYFTVNINKSLPVKRVLKKLKQKILDEGCE